jgi:hypothetical protein
MPMGHWEGASTLKADFFPGPPNFSEQPYMVEHLPSSVLQASHHSQVPIRVSEVIHSGLSSPSRGCLSSSAEQEALEMERYMIRSLFKG